MTRHSGSEQGGWPWGVEGHKKMVHFRPNGGKQTIPVMVRHPNTGFGGLFSFTHSLYTCSVCCLHGPFSLCLPVSLQVSKSGRTCLRGLRDTIPTSMTHVPSSSLPPAHSSFLSPLASNVLLQSHFGGFIFHSFGGPAVCLFAK